MYFWTVAIVVFVIWFLSREPYFYDFFVFCKDWAKEFISERWKWFRSFSVLKQTYIIVSGVIGLALFILFIALYYQLFNIISGKVKTTISTIDSNFALAFLGTVTGGVALFTGFIAILRSETNERQSTAAEDHSKAAMKQSETADQKALREQQGQIADHINKAVEGLGKSNQQGNPVIEVRIGALYELERIAKHNIHNHVQIIEMLCAYIRTNSPLVNTENEPTEPREDIRLALAIIGRRETWSDSEERIKDEADNGYRTDLRNRSLIGAQLTKASLNGAILNGANISKAVLNGASLIGTVLKDANISDSVFNDANLNDAKFENADLSDAKFENADLSDANFKNAKIINTSFTNVTINNANFRGATLKQSWLYDVNLKNANFDKADLKGAWIAEADMSNASFSGADLSKVRIRDANLTAAKFDNVNTEHIIAHKCDFSNCINLTQAQLNVMFCGVKVTIPDGLERPDHWPTDDLNYGELFNVYYEWEKEMEEEAERENQAHMDAEGLAMDMKGEEPLA